MGKKDRTFGAWGGNKKNELSKEIQLNNKNYTLTYIPATSEDDNPIIKLSEKQTPLGNFLLGNLARSFENDDNWKDIEENDKKFLQNNLYGYIHTVPDKTNKELLNNNEILQIYFKLLDEFKDAVPPRQRLLIFEKNLPEDAINSIKTIRLGKQQKIEDYLIQKIAKNTIDFKIGLGDYFQYDVSKFPRYLHLSQKDNHHAYKIKTNVIGKGDRQEDQDKIDAKEMGFLLSIAKIFRQYRIINWTLTIGYFAYLFIVNLTLSYPFVSIFTGISNLYAGDTRLRNILAIVMPILMIAGFIALAYFAPPVALIIVPLLAKGIGFATIGAALGIGKVIIDYATMIFFGSLIGGFLSREVPRIFNALFYGHPDHDEARLTKEKYNALIEKSGMDPDHAYAITQYVREKIMDLQGGITGASNPLMPDREKKYQQLFKKLSKDKIGFVRHFFEEKRNRKLEKIKGIETNLGLQPNDSKEDVNEKIRQIESIYENTSKKLLDEQINRLLKESHPKGTTIVVEHIKTDPYLYRLNENENVLTYGKKLKEKAKNGTLIGEKQSSFFKRQWNSFFNPEAYIKELQTNDLKGWSDQDIRLANEWVRRKLDLEDFTHKFFVKEKIEEKSNNKKELQLSQ